MACRGLAPLAPLPTGTDPCPRPARRTPSSPRRKYSLLAAILLSAHRCRCDEDVPTEAAPADEAQEQRVGTPGACAGASSTAYVSLLTVHRSTFKTTFLAEQLQHADHAGAVQQQLELLLVLVRSIRRVEVCRRDFVVMLGTDGPALSTTWRATLAAEGVSFYPIAPLILGSPASDKLHAWTLKRYARCVVLDADVLVLRPIDELFAMRSDFVIAHHPTDLMQAQCGIPLPRRGVGALYAMRPDAADFTRLRAYIETFRRITWHFAHYGEQTALACYFANRSSTLPCSYLVDLSNPTTSVCFAGAAGGACARQHEKLCARWSAFTMRRSCIYEPASRCDAWAGAQVCSHVSRHVQEECAWSDVAERARAVHFKGRIKPWPVGNPKRRNGACASLMIGALRRADGERLSVFDDLVWNRTRRRCESARRAPGEAVTWARGDRTVPRKCCHFETIMSARWHELLGRNAPGPPLLRPSRFA